MHFTDRGFSSGLNLLKTLGVADVEVEKLYITKHYLNTLIDIKIIKYKSIK